MATKNRETILKAIGAIGRKAASLTKDIQVTAVDVVLHAVEHGDVTLGDQLVEAVTKSIRRQSLMAWLEMNGPFVLQKGKRTFNLDKERAKAMRKEDPAQLAEQLMALPWEDAKPEPEPVSVFDVSEAFDKFLKRVDGMVKDASVTIRNKELLELLSSEATRWHAERVLASTKARTGEQLVADGVIPAAQAQHQAD